MGTCSWHVGILLLLSGTVFRNFNANGTKGNVAFFNFLCSALFAALALFLLPTASLAQGYIEASTYVGGTNSDGLGKFVVVGGETYSLGGSQSSNFPVTLGLPFAGAPNDITVTKFAADGTVIWSRYLGGSGQDLAHDLIVKNGSVYIVGETWGISGYPITTVYQPFSIGQNSVMTKLNATTGVIEYSACFGNSLSTLHAVKEWGNYVYLFGQTFGPNGRDIQVVKMDATTNAIIFDRTYGGSGDEMFINPDVFAVEGNEIYAVAVTNSANFPVTDGSTLQGSADHFYLKLDATTGDILFGTYIGGAAGSVSLINSLRIKDGGVYILGQTTETDFPVTDGGTFKGGISDWYLRKYDAATNALLYSKMIGSQGTDSNAYMEVDNGTVYLAGSITHSDGFPFTDYDDYFIGSLSKLFYAKINATTGNMVYSTAITTGGGSELVRALSVVNDEIYLGGHTSGGNLDPFFPTTDGSVKVGVFTNIFLTKLNANNQICYSTLRGFAGQSTNFNAMHVSGDNVYFTGQATHAHYPVTNNIMHKGNGDGIWTKLNLAPSVSLPASSVSPATQTVCRNGLVSTLTAPNLSISPGSFPVVYINGIAGTQTAINLRYQWQQAPTATGPWTNIPGAVQQNYLPQIGNDDMYYRRQAFISACATTPVSTSLVAAVLVNSNTAPTVNVANTVNTCAGNSVVLGGSPTATANGGATIVSYLWTPSGGYSPGDNVSNPSITPTSTTIYNVLVTDNNGCQQIGQQTVNVYSAQAGINKSACGGQPVRIGGAPISGLAGVTYSWSAFPADPSMSCTNCAQPDVNPSVPTTYTLTLTIPITGGGTCSTTSSCIVTPVGAPTTANFAGPDVVICLGNTALLGMPAESGFSYTWAPGNYLVTNNTAQVTFQPGSLAMPNPNPFTYYVTAVKNGCSFVDEMQAAVIEARAGVDGCGPRLLGKADRTPNINETYTWAKISGPGNFVGPTNIPNPAVTASVGGATVYELTVSYTLGGVTGTCTDQVVVPDCGCVVDIEVVAPFSCPSFGLNGGPNTVKLIARAADIFSSDPGVFSYSWSPAVGLSAYNTAEVYLTDNVNRTYTVTMSSPFDPSFNCTQTIEVNHPAWSLPVFTAQDVSTCPGIAVSIGQPFVAGYSYEWTGNTTLLSSTTSSNPTATVNSTNNFPVLVTDVGSGCTVRDTATVSVNIPPNLAGDDLAFCGSANVQIGKDPVAGITYLWTPAASYNPSNTAANPIVPVSATTTFTVVATNTAAGCSVTDDVTITVNPAVPPFTLPNISDCPETLGAIPLPAGPAGMSTYSWEPVALVVNPTSNGPTATTQVNRPQAITNFTLTVSNASGCTASAISVFTPSVSLPESGGNRALCLGSSVQIGGPAVAGATYTWTSSPATGLGFSATNISDPTITPTVAGTYSVTVTKNEGGCATIATATIIVNSFELSPLINTTVCENACVSLIANQVAGVQYYWSPSTGLSNPNIHNPVACVGNQSVTYTLTAIAPNGCSHVQSVVVAVNPFLAPTVSIPSVNACLIDGTAVFNPTISPSGTYTYEWAPNNGTLSSIYILNPTVNLTGVGTQTYNLTVTDTSTGCAGVATGSVDVELCPPVLCAITVTSATPSVCNPSNNTYSLSGTLTFTDPPATGTLTVSVSGGGSQTFNAPFTSPQAYNISGLTADGLPKTVTAVFSADTDCTASVGYVAPVGCVCDITVVATTPECHANGTPEDPSDDYIVFTLNADNIIQGSLYYTVTATQGGNPITITLSNGQPATAANYNLNTPLRTPAGTAGGGPIVLTITDNVYGCSITHNIVDSGTCAVACVPGVPSTVMYNYRTQFDITELNNLPLIIPQFDEQGGTRTLTSVKLDYELGFTTNSIIENSAANPQTFEAEFRCSSRIRLNSTNIATEILVIPLSETTFPAGIVVPAQGAWPGDDMTGLSPSTIGAMPWIDDYFSQFKNPLTDPRWVTNATGNPTHDDDMFYLPPTSSVGTGSIIYNMPVDLASFIGSGNVPLVTNTLNSQASSGGGGNFLIAQRTRAYADVKVTYTFECAAPCAITVASATPSVCDPATNTYSLEVVVTHSDGPGGNITVQTSNGGSITVAAGASPQTITLTGLTADGVQDIDVTAFFVDESSCTHTLPDAYDAPIGCACNLSATATGTNVLCNGGNTGTATATPSGNIGAVTYLWSNGGTTAGISGLTAGTYSVTVAESPTCTATASYQVTQPDDALTVTCSHTNVTTNGGSNGTASVVASGGTTPYTYLWSTGATTAAISGLTAGTYSVTVTDANGCTATCNVMVQQPNCPTNNCFPTGATKN